MPVQRKVLPIRRCPICDRKFQPKVKWQKYDSGRCNKKAFDLRVAAKLQRLEQLEGVA